MSTALYAPQPLPMERLRPGVGLLVLALHMGLLWVANLYSPLQHTAVGVVVVQLLRQDPGRATAAPDLSANTHSQAISNPNRQRFGRAETMLDLPAPQTQASTPLTSTAQTAQTAPTVQASPVKPSPVQAPPQPVVKAEPAPERSAQSLPAAPALRGVEEKMPEPALVPAPLPTTLPAVTAAPAAPPLATASLPSLPASAAAPLIMTSPSLSPAANGSATSAASGAASSSGSVTPGSSTPGSSAPGAGGALPAQAPTGVHAPLNLNLPPRYIYRPPIAVPRRSLSEMANDQLRRKPRDPFAEGIEAAGNIDCLKDTPEGPAQGLLAMGPLLKRAIEERCRK